MLGCCIKVGQRSMQPIFHEGDLKGEAKEKKSQPSGKFPGKVSSYTVFDVEALRRGTELLMAQQIVK